VSDTEDFAVELLCVTLQ